MPYRKEKKNVFLSIALEYFKTNEFAYETFAAASKESTEARNFQEGEGEARRGKKEIIDIR